MANMKQAIKRVGIAEKKGDLNTSKVSAMRTAIKKFNEAVENNSDNAEELFNQAVKAVDMTQASGIIHANKAAREKSKMAKKLNKAQ